MSRGQNRQTRLSGVNLRRSQGGSCPAVGGAVMPVNTLAILGPWFAVIGLVGCIGTVVVVAKKREKYRLSRHLSRRGVVVTTRS